MKSQTTEAMPHSSGHPQGKLSSSIARPVTGRVVAAVVTAGALIAGLLTGCSAATDCSTRVVFTPDGADRPIILEQSVGAATSAKDIYLLVASNFAIAPSDIATYSGYRGNQIAADDKGYVFVELRSLAETMEAGMDVSTANNGEPGGPYFSVTQAYQSEFSGFSGDHSGKLKVVSLSPDAICVTFNFKSADGADVQGSIRVDEVSKVDNSFNPL